MLSCVLLLPVHLNTSSLLLPLCCCCFCCCCCCRSVVCMHLFLNTYLQGCLRVYIKNSKILKD